jgi:hypothetical protein
MNSTSSALYKTPSMMSLVFLRTSEISIRSPS